MLENAKNRTMDSHKKMVANTWDGYVNSSSVHGIRFTSPGFSRTRRFTWALLIFTFFSILLSSFVSTVVQYFKFEVNTVVTMVSEREAKFPAVTLCNFNILRRSKFKEASKDPKYAQMLALAKMLAMMEFQGQDSSVSIPKVSGKVIREMYRYFGHKINPFEEGGMLLNCTYKKTPCNSSFFKPILTNLGQCYTFNPGRKFNKEHVGSGELTSSQPGSGYGLSLRLIVQSDEYMLIPTQEHSVGWKILIHDQEELPLVGDYGFALSPGTHTFVALMKRKIENLEPPYKTACRKEPLETGNSYSLRGCLQLCEEKYVHERCGCYSTITFLNVQDDDYCDLEKTFNCVLRARDSFRKQGNNCTCPEPCESVEYTPYLSYAYFPSDVYVVEVANHLVKAGFASSNQSAISYIKKNAIELDVFFQQMNHIVVKQIPARTVRDIYSELGGLLGASLGASFLTFLELLDFICTKIAKRLEKKRAARIIEVKSFKNEGLTTDTNSKE